MGFSAWSVGEDRLAFVRFAGAKVVAFDALCSRFGISRSCGYKWLARYAAEGAGGLEERSRRPLTSPRQSPALVEAAVVEVRRENPVWGGRKISGLLAREQGIAVAPSTVTEILRRAGVSLGVPGWAPAWQRFEAAGPNALWQMDFKGNVAFASGSGRLHPLTVLDDHSRYCIALVACDNERGETVKSCLVTAFRQHGQPARILCDNGAPWGTSAQGPLSALGVWLVERDIAISHSRPLHPETMGKDERFHRSLKAEALCGPPFEGLADARCHLDTWRRTYNHRRPHDALGGAVPADRYAPSPRPFIETPSDFDYAPDDILRKVRDHGNCKLNGKVVQVSRALVGKTIALRPTQTTGTFDIYFRHFRVRTIDLSQNQT